MPRPLVPASDDPRPSGHGPLIGSELDPEAQAVLDFLRGEQRSLVRGPASGVDAGNSLDHPEPAAPAWQDDESRDRPLYLPVASCRYAIIQYDVASALIVRRVVGLFGDVDGAENYARDSGYHLYDVVPATAVTARAP
jgi:hypothetical protein